MSNPTGLEPTQTRRPWRATIRTALAVGIPALLLLPTVMQAIIEELGPNLPPSITRWLIIAGAFVTALAALITRLMAIPAVELLLRRLPGAAFAAQPTPKPTDQPRRSGPIYVRRNGDLHFVSDPAGPPLTEEEKEAAGVSRRADGFYSDGTPIPGNPGETGAIDVGTAVLIAVLVILLLVVLGFLPLAR